MAHSVSGKGRFVGELVCVQYLRACVHVLVYVCVCVWMTVCLSYTNHNMASSSIFWGRSPSCRCTPPSRPPWYPGRTRGCRARPTRLQHTSFIHFKHYNLLATKILRNKIIAYSFCEIWLCNKVGWQKILQFAFFLIKESFIWNIFNKYGYSFLLVQVLHTILEIILLELAFNCANHSIFVFFCH
jgi:hypothetical protein